MPTEKRVEILIVGIGNELCGDDGIGAYLCACFDAMKPGGIKTLVIQQLNTELLEEFFKFDVIILADAMTGEGPVDFHPLKKHESPTSTSHHVNAGMLVALAKQLYDKEMLIMICGIKGENFGIGDPLSASAKMNAEKAITVISNWIEAGMSLQSFQSF